MNDLISKLYLKNIVLSLLYLMALIANGQELPPIKTFLPEQYQAQNQNWGISQSKEGVVYIANNAGLLKFNGARWELFSVPNKSIIRSVKVIGDKIFTGSFMDFGFWEENEYGNLNYTSLVKPLKLELLESEQFWNITTSDNWVLFQSLSRIYLIDLKNGKAKIIESNGNILKVFTLGQKVYFQKKGEGLYKIENGRSILITNSEIVQSNKIINLFELNNQLLILTENKGLFFFKDNVFTKWNIDLDFNDYSIYSGVQLKNKNIFLGTIANGLFQIDTTGKIIYKINRTNGLSNNTVLSMFEDSQENLWLGLDYGINCINLASDFDVFVDDKGEIGTVYTSISYKGNLYLGTNQGLFYKEEKSNKAFKFIPKTEGQVWVLKVIDGTLFCGHNKGTLIIEKNQVFKELTKSLGTWDLKKIKGRENCILQGNYEGLSILKKNFNSWEHVSKIKGFDISSRFFEVENNNIYVNHELKGFYKLKIDEKFTEVIESKKIEIKEKGFGSSILNFNSGLIYAFSKGIYRKQSDVFFVKDTLFSNLFKPFKELTTLFPVRGSDEDKLWRYIDNNIAIITPGNISETPQIEIIPISKSIKKTVSGFENVTQIDIDKYLIGSSNGYVILNKKNKTFDKKHIISINKIGVHEISKPFDFLNLRNKNTLKSTQNNIQFHFSFPSFNKIFTNQYQYQLIGQSDQWSEWSTNSTQLFENLPFGDYTFNVRGKIGNKTTYNTASYSFVIDRPLFLSNKAIVVYVLLLFLFFWFIHRSYNAYYKKQQEIALRKTKIALAQKKLESARELTQLNNEKLKLEIENKNQELASSTSNLIKKNEILNTIKKELQKAKTQKEGIQNVKKIIETNLNSEDDWRYFEKAFNNTDKDFLKKIKRLHSNLTPNDLRFCTYLRLNLSSKEIAPLLNISTRSVEIKRYRLRKKLNLEHSEGLVNYILAI